MSNTTHTQRALDNAEGLTPEDHRQAMRAQPHICTYPISAGAAARCKASAFGTSYLEPFLKQLDPISRGAMLEYTLSDHTMDQADKAHCQVLGLDIEPLAGCGPLFLRDIMVLAALHPGLGAGKGRSERTEACWEAWKEQKMGGLVRSQEEKADHIERQEIYARSKKTPADWFRSVYPEQRHQVMLAQDDQSLATLPPDMLHDFCDFVLKDYEERTGKTSVKSVFTFELPPRSASTSEFVDRSETVNWRPITEDSGKRGYDERTYSVLSPYPFDAMPSVTEWPDWVRKDFARGNWMFTVENGIDSLELVEDDEVLKLWLVEVANKEGWKLYQAPEEAVDGGDSLAVDQVD